MALDGHTANVGLLSATNPDDQTVIATPIGQRRNYVFSIHITVNTAAASTVIILEDGVGGDVICQVSGATVGTTEFLFPRGYALVEGGLLNVTNEGATGAVARIVAQYSREREVIG
jgi:hypothetical protein